MAAAKKTATKKLVVRDLENLKGGVVTTTFEGEVEGIPMVGKKSGKVTTTSELAARDKSSATTAGRISG